MTKIKSYICRLIGHRWEPKWHCHNRYYGLTCSRCGKKTGKKND